MIDLTRPDYDDVVTITDYPSTVITRQVGAALAGRPVAVLARQREVWDKGPHGLGLSIFFWGLAGKGEQGRGGLVGLQIRGGGGGGGLSDCGVSPTDVANSKRMKERTSVKSGAPAWDEKALV